MRRAALERRCMAAAQRLNQTGTFEAKLFAWVVYRRDARTVVTIARKPPWRASFAMKFSLIFAAAVGMLPVPTSRHYSAWQYQRTVAPAPEAPLSGQCVVLDAAAFAHAAPGLRDLRLLQDDREIPYALDESHDPAFDQAALSNTDKATSLGNRAQYETSLLIPAYPSHKAAVAGLTTSITADHLPGWFHGEADLSAHVPVERIRVLPAPSANESLRLDAWQSTNQKDHESLEALLTPQVPAVNFTIGANLQHTAGIRIDVHGPMPLITVFALEMRRRELCFQPLSPKPLTLLLGNGNARPVRYEYARNFHPTPSPLLATLGPVQPNPGYGIGTVRQIQTFALDRILLAISAGGALMMLVSASLHRRRTH